jgi:hypothetical protein
MDAGDVEPDRLREPAPTGPTFVLDGGDGAEPAIGPEARRRARADWIEAGKKTGSQGIADAEEFRNELPVRESES